MTTPMPRLTFTEIMPNEHNEWKIGFKELSEDKRYIVMVITAGGRYTEVTETKMISSHEEAVAFFSEQLGRATM